MENKEKQMFYKLLTSGKFAEMVKEAVIDQEVCASPKELYNTMKPLVAEDPDREQFWVIFLDANNHILEIDKMFTGSLTTAAVHPRELIKKVIELKACAIICCHNHPTGIVDPSPEDVMVTFQILIACNAVETQLYEHIIVGRNGEEYFSMAEAGIIVMLAELRQTICNDLGAFQRKKISSKKRS